MNHTLGGAYLRPPPGGRGGASPASRASKASYSRAAALPVEAHVALYLLPKRTTVPVSCMRPSSLSDSAI